MSEPLPLSADELEMLWREAWRVARRACHATLVRLRMGHGGFYGADDLHQDLFLGFRRLALTWAARQPRPPESELWAAWRRRLWHGGARYYRKRPQRLWMGRQLPLAPEALTLDGGDEADGWGEDSLPNHAIEQLTERDAMLEGLEAEDAVRSALAALRTLPADQQRLLELVAVQGCSLAEAGRAMGLPPGQATCQRLYRARRALERAMQWAARQGQS